MRKKKKQMVNELKIAVFYTEFIVKQIEKLIIKIKISVGDFNWLICYLA